MSEESRSALARAATRLIVPTLVAMAASIGLTALVASLSGASIVAAVAALISGSVGSATSVSETLVQTTPLLLTGAAVMLAFRSGVFNIGAEGQFLVGALAGAAAGTALPAFPGQVLLVITLGAAAGAAWAAIAAALRIRRGVGEVITTILLNFLALYLVSYAVNGPLQEASGYYPQSDRLPAEATLWNIVPGTRLHLGVPLAIVLAIAVGFLLARTSLGLRLRAAGLNADAARLAGFPVRRDLAVAFALSGGLAGLAGAIEVAGVTGRLYERISPGYGYTAIAIALLGGLRSGGVMAAAVFFAALGQGAGAMERSAGISSVLVVAIQGATLLGVAIANAEGARKWLRGILPTRAVEVRDGD